MALAALTLSVGGPLVVGASAASPPPGAPARTTAPHTWWERAGLRGRSVTAVEVDGADLVVHAGGRRLLSHDGGATYARVAAGGFAGPRESCPRGLRSPVQMVVCAAPPGLPGLLVSVDADGGVWRRTTAGEWSHSLLLLPQGGLAPAPRVTAIAAFSGAATTDTVYLATDGYSVLESTDGGDDWLRGGPGLPDRVLSLAADSAGRTLYAGTADGLWRHRLQPLPAPPRYPAGDLRTRRIATLLVTLLASAAGLAALRAVLRGGPGAARG